MQRRKFGLALAGGAAWLAGGAEAAERALELTLRRRAEETGGEFRIREERARWPGAETAVIVCDVWDAHWCKGATSRVVELAPRIDRFLVAARDRGALVIHAPSGCMEFYRDHPARRRAQSAPPAANRPPEIAQWCRSIPAEERGKYPIDQSDGGCDCRPTCATGSPWRRQIDAIAIRDEDAISDSGTEIWDLMAARGIGSALLLGVHTNMCVLGRPFGLRNLSRYGKKVALVRDLTDTMYNSRAWPFVHHFRGTDLVVEHIEKYVCPTVVSSQLLGGSPFRFREDPQKG